jgi:DoxX-like family
MDTVLASPPLATRTTRTSRAEVWTGRVLTGLIVAFLLVDAVAKLIPLAPVVEATQKVGFSVDVIRPLGLVLAVSTLLHVIRRTQLLGAVLVTAYLGGATATHVHSTTPFWFPVVMGVILWVAYGLRSPQLRAIVLSAR